MGGPPMGAGSAPMCLISLIIAAGGRVALVIGHRERWLPQAGYTFVPLELPGGPAEPGATDRDLVDRLARHWLGQPGQLVPSAWTYGPTAAHAIDRVRVAPAGSGEPSPLLRLERMVPEEPASGPGLRTVAVRAYRAALDGPAQPGPAVAGILWLTPEALRVAVRGVPLSDLLERDDVRAQLVEPPAELEEALIYVPAEYGERYLLRVMAKYGQGVIFRGG